jgi:small subunit ribosomal protein S21
LAVFSVLIRSFKSNGTNGGREEWMPAVIIREGESFESALKRFKKQCEKTGILSEIKKREHYEKPSVKRKKKILAAKKRALKKLKRTMDKGLY